MRPPAPGLFLALFPLLNAACVMESQPPPTMMATQQMQPAQWQSQDAPPRYAWPQTQQLQPSMAQPQGLVLNPGASLQFQYNVEYSADGTVVARPMMRGPAVSGQATACFNVSMAPDGTVVARPGAPLPGASGRIVVSGALSGYQLSAQNDGTLTARPSGPDRALQVRGGVASLCYSVQSQPDGTLVARPGNPGVLQFGAAQQSAVPQGPVVQPQQPPANVQPAQGNGGGCAYQCVVDTQSGSSNCQGPVTLSDPNPSRPVAVMDMTGFTELQLTLQMCNPRGWVLNLGDSPTNNGYGGDGGQFSNDAELQLVNEALSVYGSDTNAQGAATMLYQHASFGLVGGCIERRLRVRDGALLASAPPIALQSPALLRLDAPDREGAPDRRWYLGMNRVIADTSRAGSGLNRVEFCLR